MAATVPEISDLLTVTDGFAKPKWDAIASRIEATVEPRSRFDAWTGAVRQWLDTMCSALGEGYASAESAHFAIMLPPNVPCDAVLALSERCRRMLYEVLPGIAAFSAPGKEVLLVFRDRATCDRYLSLWIPSDRFLGGAQVCAGYPHVAATGLNYDYLEHTLAHELAHLSLWKLSLPVWIDEGVAQLISQDMTGFGALRMTGKAARRQRQHWRKHGLSAFWSGMGFSRADDGRCAMCYDLAEILVRFLLEDHRPGWFGLRRGRQQRLSDFIRAADRLDSGEAAARKHLGFSLANLAARFLGPGDWTPISAERLAATLNYPLDAIKFVLAAIVESGGATTRAVVEALRLHAIARFGKGARDALRSWRILCSEDVGTIVEGLVREGLLIREEGDSFADFVGQFNVDELFAQR